MAKTMTDAELLKKYREEAVRYVGMLKGSKLTFDRLRSKVLIQDQKKDYPWCKFYWGMVAHQSEEESKALRDALERGRCVIDTPSLLFGYLYWNAPKIMEKLHRAYVSLQAKRDILALVNGDYALIDWACGQGLGSMALYDFIEDLQGGQGSRPLPTEAILIEPSELALDNAAFHLGLYGVEEPKKIAKVIAESQLSVDEVAVSAPRTFHILSHIVDMLDDADLRHLASLILGSSAGEHYVICVCPTHSYQDVPENLRKFEQYLADTSNDDGSGRKIEVIATTEDVPPAEGEDEMELLILKVDSALR